MRVLNTKAMQNKKGFSFLEVIIVVAIIVIMTMVMFVISFKDRSKKELEAVGREVAAAIRETQNNALTGRQQDNDNLPCSFAFETYDDGKKYRIVGTQRELGEDCPTDTVIGKYDHVFLEEDVSAQGMHITGEDSERRSSKYVIFSVPYGKYYDDGSYDDLGTVNGELSTGTDFVITKDNDETHKFHVCVYSTGLIEELGFNDDPVACPFY